MRRDQLAFLVAGLAFGFLVGFGVFRATSTAPRLDGSAAAVADDAGPRGPAAPTQMGQPPAAGGGGPMVAEINALKRRVEQDPRDLAALVRLANLHHDVGMWAQAASYYERAIEIDGRNPDLLTDLGVAYRGLGEFERALEMFSRAHAIDAGHWQSVYNIVIVSAFDLSRFDAARAALRELESVVPPPPNLPELRRRVDELAAAAPGPS